MAKTKRLSLETRQSVAVLRSEGYSLRNIAKKLKISYKGVHYCLARKDVGAVYNTICEAWWRKCDDMGLLWCNSGGWFASCAGNIESTWLSFNSAATCHPIWKTLDWCQFCYAAGQWPEAHLEVVQTIPGEEGVRWSTVYDGLATTVSRLKPNWAFVGTAWSQSSRKMPNKYLTLYGNCCKKPGVRILNAKDLQGCHCCNWRIFWWKQNMKCENVSITIS